MCIVRFVIQCNDFGMYSMPRARTVEVVNDTGRLASTVKSRLSSGSVVPSSISSRQDTNALQTVFPRANR